MQTITRIFDFDTAHRVMNERVKCFNLHGHRFRAEVTFGYDVLKAIGYAVDFKELKRILGTFIDENFDHAAMLNPLDAELIKVVENNGWKLWLMGLGDNGDNNPSAENIASEIHYIADLFFNKDKHGIWVENVRLYETPNCWVDCNEHHYSATDEVRKELEEYRFSMGDMEYDLREVL